MEQSKNDIRSAYDSAAGNYAKKFINELDYKPRDVEWLSYFAESLGQPGEVLDIGCGPGHTTEHLRQIGLNPTGMDLSPKMIEHARKLFPECRFSVGDFFDLPVADASFQGVLAFYCIVHLKLEELTQAFTEMFRVLKAEGVLLLSFHIGDCPVFVEDFLESGASLEFSTFPSTDVAQALEKAGFANLEIHERPPYEQEAQTTRCYIFARKQ